MKKILLFLLLFVTVFSLAGKNPKYIILFIGDGMAVPQRMIAEEYAKKTGKGKLLLNTLPFHATTKTNSANALITDSAAAATAIACGVKTNNGMIGMTPQKKKVTSVAEEAKKKNRKVGIISSVTINHATPAGFYGHRTSRSSYYELGLDLVASGFDFFGGGGIAQHGKKSPDIFALAQEKGYKIHQGKKGLSAAKKGEKCIFIAASKSSRMPYVIDLEKNIPTLAQITEKAIEVLDNPHGFFLMVEGGAIDWAGHGNEAAANIHEVLALDEAVKKAYEFYKKHPQETLIVVTGDHETGGMTMGFAGSGYQMKVELLANQKCSVGVFQSELASMRKKKKDLSFEDVKPLITEKFGFIFEKGNKKDPMLVTAKELQELQKSFARKRLHHAVRILMNKKTGIGWASGNHTALPVLTTSIGKKAEHFTGLMDNTDIAKKLKNLL